MPQSGTVGRRIVLAARPRGLPTLQDFRLDEVAVPTPSEGQVLLRTLYLSLDPYMRSLMNEVGPTYAVGAAGRADGRRHGQPCRRLQALSIPRRRPGARQRRLAGLRAVGRKI